MLSPSITPCQKAYCTHRSKYILHLSYFGFKSLGVGPSLLLGTLRFCPMLGLNLDVLYSLKPGRFHCYSVVKEVSFGVTEERLGIPGGCQAAWCPGISKATVSPLPRACVRVLFSAGREDTPGVNLRLSLFSTRWECFLCKIPLLHLGLLRHTSQK